MRRIAIALLGITTLLFHFTASAQEIQEETAEQKAKRMAWFKDAKLGIFIHWGIYAVNGIDESWSFFNGYISHEDYMKQLDSFTAANYDPEAWAKLIKESGAQYAVITTRHHDGVALWDTQYGDLSIPKKSAAKRDVLAPFTKALQKNNLKVGLYYSLSDWSHPDYPLHLRDTYRYKNDPKRWEKYLTYMFGQMEELSTQYQPDLYWFDGDWEHSAEEWKSKELRQKLLTWRPNVILNSRLQGYGDYATPEQGVPVTAPKNPYWELCMTMNNSWGHQDNDLNYKTPSQVIRIFIDCITMGGNLLLDIGPKADGTIPEQQVHILKELGRWTNKHKEAIYETIGGIPHGHFYGPTNLSKDKKTLFLYLLHKPNGPIVIKGLKNKVNRIRIVGNGTKLGHKVIGKQYWSEVPGLLYIDVPEEDLDPTVTVIALQLKGEVDLYREDGKVIESN
ncbi:alpha-L-fucosidase [Rapidithrix thailandica]|uniref:alpha-L-fucosidase n=1 Tax=Rapidithrix thailandica TaxID=413964 RepID=A0AAW9RZ49_9BACT